MARTRKKRCNSHGSAWHWTQTDCWYYTPPGTKRRVPLFDENGQRIRGQDGRGSAEQTLARIRISGEMDGRAVATAPEWIVARVCSE